MEIKYNKILIRYGELVLKGRNRKLFTRQLKNNVENILKTKAISQYDRMFVEYKEEYLEKLKYIPGIKSYSPVIELEKDLSLIEPVIDQFYNPKYKTFRVSARRNDKNFYKTSNEINLYFGSYILKKYPLEVNLKKFDWEIIIEIRHDAIYVIMEHYESLVGGLPVNSSGRTIHLLSGGFDSPVAAINMMKRGIKVVFLAFITPPHTDQGTINKLYDLAKVFSKYQGKTKLYLSNYTELMNYLSLMSDQSYKINLMRRSFVRIASLLAKIEKSLILSTGENLGQVASQTIESLHTISEQSKYEILRPLITENKQDIINLSQKYGTHDISIKQCAESCELFAPDRPVIKPTVKRAYELEQELEEIPNLEKEVFENLELIEFE
ncbi:thiamine biosynthesis protein ThiI [Mycoplasma testudineum]|uniref:Probable tRNA sulfurtransferase n=1 Tax=Mycoplasma testudineum TaxID=244584 RepID=A0A4R6ICE6_9MOLU|nr:tRNA uracil 4-sulfurtransferase ThiI [Mycoplasma testudineum]OYD26787.1 tRNA 4-thiouridine(8) synthase ThiI [Mycoplasma testudineum]TDO19923.1 thiamine biosynthesis protein ThiI [Mycoplasma testudineum]